MNVQAETEVKHAPFCNHSHQCPIAWITIDPDHSNFLNRAPTSLSTWKIADLEYYVRYLVLKLGFSQNKKFVLHV